MQCNKNLQDPPQKMGKGLMCIHTYIHANMCMFIEAVLYLHLSHYQAEVCVKNSMNWR